MNQTERRTLVSNIISMRGTASPKEIRDILQTDHKITVSYQTVYNDVMYVKQTSSRWLADAVNTGWQNRLMTLYREINDDIKQLRELRDSIISNGEPEKVGGRVAFIDKVIIEQMTFLKDFADDAILYRRLTEYLERGNTDALEKLKSEIELSHNKEQNP